MTPLSIDSLTADLQRRIARLLLRHDRRTFRGRFREIYAGSRLPQPELLRAYDRFTRVLALADDLFDDILLRIRRQMSFHATRLRLDEEAPLRGQIDWNRSLQRMWNERPDQPPLRFATTLRSRTFATPENRLVVAVLQRYLFILGQIRLDQAFTDSPLSQAEQREIAQIADRVRRELATAHFQELSRENEAAHVSELAEQVERRLRGASPYADLLGWWRRIEQLHVRMKASAPPSAALDAPEHAGLLYQLWLALELADFLSEKGCLSESEPETRANRLSFRFTWQGRPLSLVYDRQPTAHLAWIGAPKERPDYFISPCDPLEVKHCETMIWREPGVLLDAKCYTTEGASRASEAIKRMIADMQLVDAAYGALILPDISGLARDIHPDPGRYVGNAARDSHVRLFELRPLTEQSVLWGGLAELLDLVSGWLPERPPIACHGRWPDRDTVTPAVAASIPLEPGAAPLIFCPKPHISRWRVDLVDPKADCLTNPQVCHILTDRQAHGLIPPFVRRILTREDLQHAIGLLRERLNGRVDADNPSDEAESARSTLIEAIGDLADSYRALMRPDTTQIESELKWMFRGHWSEAQHKRGLPEDTRNMLISGQFVWYEFQKITVEDWAACAVQYVRAIEREFQRRLYDACSGDQHLRNRKGRQLQKREFTFGTVKHAFEHRPTDHNWRVFIDRAVIPSGASEAQFESVIDELIKLHSLRNEIAHSTAIDEARAARVHRIALGDSDTGSEGALSRFVALLDPPP